jgi:hypothetical protein
MAAKKTPAKEPEQKFVLRLPESPHHALRYVSIARVMRPYLEALA